MSSDQNWPFDQIQRLSWWLQALIWPPVIVVMLIWSLIGIPCIMCMIAMAWVKQFRDEHRFRTEMRKRGKLMSVQQVVLKQRSGDGWLLTQELATAGWWLPSTCVDLSPEHTLLTWTEVDVLMQDSERYRRREWITPAMQSWADRFRAEGFERVSYVPSTFGVDWNDRAFLMDGDVYRDLVHYWKEQTKVMNSR